MKEPYIKHQGTPLELRLNSPENVWRVISDATLVARLPPHKVDHLGFDNVFFTLIHNKDINTCCNDSNLLYLLFEYSFSDPIPRDPMRGDNNFFKISGIYSSQELVNDLRRKYNRTY